MLVFGNKSTEAIKTNYKETKHDIDIGSLKMKSFSREWSVFPDHDASVQHIPAVQNGKSFRQVGIGSGYW